MTTTETPVVLSGGTKITWAHFTWNPWWGCARVSPACDHCYAELLAKRFGHKVWGRDEPRRFFGEKHWNDPIRWDRKAEKAGVRYRVFCASMADVFEGRTDLDPHRARLWDLIEATPHLDWLLLTKRPENIARMVPAPWLGLWPLNAWIGTTVENKRYANLRIPKLLEVPAAVRFLSCEPLLGPVNLAPWIDQLQWVITGGESGHHARPMHPDWVRSIRDQCQAAGVAHHFKQWGEFVPTDGRAGSHRVRYDGEWYPNTATCLMSNEEGVDRIGKKAAGRLLDGRTWDEIPETVR